MRPATIVAAIERELSSSEWSTLAAADWLEVHADRFEADPRALRRAFDGALLYMCGVRGDARSERLVRALAHYDLIGLEPEDLVDEVLAAIPPQRRVVTATVPGADLPRILGVPARLHRVVVTARSYAATLEPFRLLRALGRDDVIAYADGPLGTWTRVLAPHFGAPFVFAKASGRVEEDGVPTVAQLVSDYGLPYRWEVREIFGIAGDPIFGSLSPRLHNAAFRAVGRHALYVPFHVPDFGDFWDHLVFRSPLDALGLPMRALCVVSPYKEVAISAAGGKTPIVARTKSSNFFLREGGQWTADTTDPEGVMLELRERGIDVTGKRAAVVGCGGSGRAIAAALHQAGAEVTLANRGFNRGSFAVNLLHLPFVPLAAFSASAYELIVNATPVGRDGDDAPFALDEMRDDAVVIDLVYGERPTPLIAHTRRNGQVAIDGKDILRRQAMSQFRLMTGLDMPEALVRSLLGREAEVAVSVAKGAG